MHRDRQRNTRWKSVVAAVIALAPSVLAAQVPGSIRGTVTSAASNAPLGNAQVFVVGTTLGSQSNADGSYSIPAVPPGPHVVRVRLIGYAPAEKSVTVTSGTATTLVFALTQSAVSLDEVVVTGTGGSARKREVGNSIGQIKVSDTPEVPTNLSNMLSGRIAGVTVGGNVGNSGGGSAIRLRGSTSVALTNQPLIYIDGVRTRSDEYPRNGIFTGTTQRGANSYSSPLNDINPDDIDRIEVVKGAAAATLYGTDAAAGVIQIFTKRGLQGAAKWQAQINSGISQLQKFGTDDKFANPMKGLRQNWLGGIDNRDSVDAKLLFMDPFLRNGGRFGANVQVSGGTSETRYLLSLGADNTDGVLPNDREKKYQVRANVDFAPFKKLAVNWNSAYTNNLISNTPAGNNAQGVTLNAFRRDRNYFASTNPDTIGRVFSQQLFSNIDRLVLGTTATWTPIEHFSSRFTVGFDRAALENRNVRPYGFPNAPLGVIQNQRWANNTISTDWVNNYDFNLTKDLRVTASAGTQYVNSLVGDVVAFSENFATPAAPTVASGGIKNADENRQTVITGGAFGQALVGFKDRYFVTVGGRIDGNSAFGKDFGFQTYPKVSGSWVISEERFWNPALGTLKLRSAYGTAGRAPGAFAAARTYSQVGWGGQVAVRPNNLGNATLGPERTTELEIGFDESIFSGRLNVDFTWFKAKTTDALFNVRSVPSNGFLNSTLKNVGQMQKSGIEAALTGTVLDRRNLGITAGLNISTNQSEVLSLGGANSFTVGNFGWVIAGQPAPVLRGKIIRDPNRRVTATEALLPTDTASNYNFGPSNPTKIIGGNINIRTWKNINLSVRSEYQGGAYIDEDASFQALTRSVLWPTCTSAYKNLAASQPITVRERLTCIPANVRSDMFIFKADFFKVRDITVTVPLGRLIPRTNSSSFVFSAQNIFRRNYGMPLFDPEMSGNDGFNATVRYISEMIPAPAVFLTSLRISF